MTDIAELSMVSHLTNLRESRPLARLSHTCSVCGQPIAIGSRYSRTVVIDAESIRNRLKVIRWHLPHCPEA